MEAKKKKIMLITALITAGVLVFSSAIIGILALIGVFSKDNDPDNVIKGSGYYIAKDGTSDYKIVVPDVSEYEERYVADELASFFEDASGVKLSIVTDNGLDFNASSKYISIGRTALLTKAGIESSAVPSMQGFIIKTVNQSVFMTGGNSLGTMYSVYEFLHHQIGFEAYAADEIFINTELKEVELLAFNLTDSPDIMYRQPNYGSVDTNVVAAQRMRFNPGIWMQKDFHWIHNSTGEYFPYDTYLASHPDWYSSTKFTSGANMGKPSQLCYTAHGNAEELKLMQDTLLERLKEIVSYHYDAGRRLESISFTQNDDPQWCGCDACQASRVAYGQDSATLIRFINPVAKEFKNWLDTAYPGATVNIVIFAYFATVNAPVKEVNGVLVANDESVIPEKNVAIFYAPYTGVDYHYDFTYTKNQSAYETMKMWGAITDNLYFWFYNAYFHNYFSWYDSFNSMQANYRIAKEMGATYIFYQGRYDASTLTGFDTLKVYLDSKLGWNVNADVKTLTDNFFRDYYKVAGGYMKEYYESYRVWMEYVRQNNLLTGGTANMQNILLYSSATTFPKNVLLNWMSLIDKAYAEIEQYKSNIELYQKLHDRITCESMAVRYFLIQLHSATYSATEVIEMKLAFKNDAERLGFTTYKEGSGLETLWQEWKIQ